MPKVKYEVFNPRTGQFEDASDDSEEVDAALNRFLTDYQVYESEKHVVRTIMEMQLNNNIHPRMGNLD